MVKTDRFLIVTVPVANLRRKPVNGKLAYLYDELQETQVLYNETLRYIDEIDDWYYVEAIEQQKYTPGKAWHGYPGWIRKHNVAMIDAPFTYNAVVKNKTAPIFKSRSEKAGVLLTVLIGTRLFTDGPTDNKYYPVVLAGNKKGCIRKEDVTTADASVNEDALRKAIVDTGMLFLGVPYLWGGRSMHIYQSLKIVQRAEGRGQKSENAKILNIQNSTPDAVLTGVDCSGFTNLVYRTNHIDIPRDAHEQWMAARKIDGALLEPGDFIFVSAEGNPDSIVHVMISVDRERFIEALKTGDAVKVNTFSDRFGEDFEMLTAHNFLVRNNQIYFGSIISK